MVAVLHILGMITLLVSRNFKFATTLSEKTDDGIFQMCLTIFHSAHILRLLARSL
jgi:hypothetical protein